MHISLVSLKVQITSAWVKKMSAVRLPLVVMLVGVLHCALQGKVRAFSLSYPNDSPSDLIFLGDATEEHGLIELTRNTYSETPDDSTGRVLCSIPVRMIDPKTNQSASFSTSFSFKIFSVNNSLKGDGLAFLIAPDNVTVGHYGEQLGAFGLSNNAANDHTFAVEFDTWKNSDINDPNGNHVGLDFSNVSSFAYNNASNAGVQLNDGSIIRAWIDYDGTTENLQVRIGPNSSEPKDALINVSFSFVGFFNELMYVGFSASTGLSNELHTIISWNFTSWGLPDYFNPVPEVASMNKNRAESKVVLLLGIVLGGCFASLGIGMMSWCALRNRRENYFRRARDYDSKLAYGPKVFTYKELHAATQGFSKKEKLGANSLGSVFRGVLVDSGAPVAVKQISKDPHKGLQEFIAEATMICCLRNRNVVPLHGWCLEKGVLMLVYEFMPNGSLDKFLFGSRCEILSWAHRHNIVSGLASAMHYLHEGWEQSIVHGDVKASNVFLDTNFNARLGDFGLARYLDHERSPEKRLIAGTFGYIAPEAVQTGRSTAKTDVFSFGAVTLEVVCGRRALETGLASNEAVLVDWVWELHGQGRLLDAADQKLEGCFDVGEMECLLRVGLLCSQPDPYARPSMQEVDRFLSGEAPLPPLPLSKPMPAFPSDTLFVSIEELLADASNVRSSEFEASTSSSEQPSSSSSL